MNIKELAIKFFRKTKVNKNTEYVSETDPNFKIRGIDLILMPGKNLQCSPLNLRMILIKFLLEKRDLIDKFTGRLNGYIVSEDIDTILNWPLSKCVIFAESFINSSLDETVSDHIICPWCVVLERRCVACEYRLYHDVCQSHDIATTYGKITKILRGEGLTSISQIPGMMDLMRKYKPMFKIILNLLEF